MNRTSRTSTAKGHHRREEIAGTAETEAIVETAEVEADALVEAGVADAVAVVVAVADGTAAVAMEVTAEAGTKELDS